MRVSMVCTSNKSVDRRKFFTSPKNRFLSISYEVAAAAAAVVVLLGIFLRSFFSIIAPMRSNIILYTETERQTNSPSAHSIRRFITNGNSIGFAATLSSSRTSLGNILANTYVHVHTRNDIGLINFDL